LAVPGGRDAALLLLARISMSSQRALVGVITTVYLAQLGFSALKLAVLFALVAVCSTLMSAGIGTVADRIGRKPFMVALPLMTAGCGLVFAVTDNMVALFVAAALGSFGRGSGAGGGQIGPYTPAEQALLAGLVRDRLRPKLFGLVASASAAGGLIGALLVALPTGHAAAGPIGPGTYRLAFCVSAVLATVAGLLAVPVREQSARESRRERRPHQPLSAQARGLVARLWAVNAANGIAVGLFGPFVTYFFYRQYNAGTSEIGTLYLVVNAVTLLTNFLAAPVAARIGVVRTVVAARTLQALLLLPLAVAPSFLDAGGIYLARMMVQRFGMAMRQSFVMSAAPPADRARVAAYSALPTQALSAAAPTLSGYLMDEVSLSLPFELAGLLQLVNAGLFYAFFRHFRAPLDEPPPTTSVTPTASVETAAPVEPAHAHGRPPDSG
jgi:MFS family permease